MTTEKAVLDAPAGGSAAGPSSGPPKAEAVVMVKTAGESKKVQFKENMTVGQAVSAAGIPTKWRTKFSVNGQGARSSAVLKAGDTVTVIPRIKNG